MLMVAHKVKTLIGNLLRTLPILKFFRYAEIYFSQNKNMSRGANFCWLPQKSRIVSLLDAEILRSVTTKILCYADDTLVFLNNPQVIQRLRFHLDMLSLASNARINYHKVESIFMFDRDHSRYWVGSLAELEILSIYLPSNPQSVLYLGFLLIQSRIQREAFMTQFITRMHQQIILHST